MAEIRVVLARSPLQLRPHPSQRPRFRAFVKRILRIYWMLVDDYLPPPRFHVKTAARGPPSATARFMSEVELRF